MNAIPIDQHTCVIRPSSGGSNHGDENNTTDVVIWNIIDIEF